MQTASDVRYDPYDIDIHRDPIDRLRRAAATPPRGNHLSGGRGIRTPGGLPLNGFQDRRIRPLCHPSERPDRAGRVS